MLFHRGQHAQITLHPSGVVIMDIGLNHLHKLPLAGKPSAVIAFPLQNAPEVLHGAVINAVRYAGHTLRHSRLHELPREQVKTIIFRYIFIYYNRVRVYTRNPLGLPPVKYREWVWERQAA